MQPSRVLKKLPIFLVLVTLICAATTSSSSVPLASYITDSCTSAVKELVLHEIRDTNSQSVSGITKGQQEVKGLVRSGQQELQKDHQDLKSSQQVLQSGQQEIKNVQKELKNGSQELRNGQQVIKSEQLELKNGQQEIRNGQQAIKSEQLELKSGQQELQNGQQEIATALRQLQDQMASLQPPAPEDCPPDWRRHQDICYYVTRQDTTWIAAHHACSSVDRRARLASIHPSSAAFVKDLVKSDSPEPSLWIGLARLTPGGSWSWIDGTPVDFTDWASGQPENVGGVEDCAHVGPRAWSLERQWHDNSCNREFRSVCQITLI